MFLIKPEELDSVKKIREEYKNIPSIQENYRLSVKGFRRPYDPSDIISYLMDEKAVQNSTKGFKMENVSFLPQFIKSPSLKLFPVSRISFHDWSVGEDM